MLSLPLMVFGGHFSALVLRNPGGNLEFWMCLGCILPPPRPRPTVILLGSPICVNCRRAAELTCRRCRRRRRRRRRQKSGVCCTPPLLLLFLAIADDSV